MEMASDRNISLRLTVEVDGYAHCTKLALRFKRGNKKHVRKEQSLLPPLLILVSNKTTKVGIIMAAPVLKRRLRLLRDNAKKS